MFVVRNYVTMCGTVICALGIGYLMQNGNAAQPEGAQQVVSAADQASVIAGLESIVLTSSTPDDTPASPAVPPQRSSPAKPTPPQNHTNCSISARATALPGANARLHIKAPCRSDQRVEVHHSGLTVTQQTDAAGALDLTVPALSEYAIFLISFEDQTGTVATTHITDIDQYDRVALQWQGQTDLQIHALEFGANYGEQGHISADGTTHGAGSVVHLGTSDVSDGQNIQIYSFPAAQSEQSGAITLSVEAEVTDANCGRDLNVQSLELRSDRRLRSRDLILTMPMCTQVGEFLVLNNLFQDLTIAAK